MQVVAAAKELLLYMRLQVLTQPPTLGLCVIQSGSSSCSAEQVNKMLACALFMTPADVHEKSVAFNTGWCLLGWPKPFRA